MRIYEQGNGAYVAVARLFAGCVRSHLNPPAGDSAWMNQIHTSLPKPGMEEMAP